MLTRDQLLKPVRPVTTLRIPELDGDVLLMPMTAAERDDWDAEQYAAQESGTGGALSNFRARLVVRCLVDENGARLFSDADALAFGNQSAAIVDRLFDVCKRISGISSDEEDKQAKN